MGDTTPDAAHPATGKWPEISVAVSGKADLDCSHAGGNYHSSCDNLRLNVNRELPVAAGALDLHCGLRACRFARVN